MNRGILNAYEIAILNNFGFKKLFYVSIQR